MTQGSWTNDIARILAHLGAEVAVLVNPKKLKAAYAWADRVLLPGGADIHPDWYGQKLTHARPFAPERDDIEYQLAEMCLFDAKPLMGICRGHQMITIAAGGTLHQDIRWCLGIHHSAYDHALKVDQHTRLATLLPKKLRVSSYHHQSTAVVPDGWHVAATSAGGAIIEAIEHPTLPVISVQWHPEVHPHTPDSKALFKAFIALNSN